ncbi:hypothetical protein [Acaryochloris sp. IP29b_bin.137]|uniref:hypothetical protein n=1 Tax=Acaryochloris sp. IP29b_bin.137 TaxID=2969217 RepID=UPI002629346F|nr:hypothetical protein [Acaryochloris sp. IP29b_bin.137]
MIKPTHSPLYQAAEDSHVSGAGGSQPPLPYQPISLWGASVAFVGEFDVTLETLQAFCKRFEAEVVADFEADITLLVVGNHAPTVETSATVCSEAELLNLTDWAPPSFPALINRLMAEGFDITYRSNEGDGFQTTFQCPTESNELSSALLAYARQSEVVQRIMAEAPRRYSARQLAKVSADFTLLDAQDPNQGWYRFLEISEFAWDFDAISDRIIVSGLSLLKTMQACVGEIAVLAIHDQALANSVDAVHIIGGLDPQGQLMGLILHRVWT